MISGDFLPIIGIDVNQLLVLWLSEKQPQFEHRTTALKDIESTEKHGTHLPDALFARLYDRLSLLIENLSFFRINSGKPSL